MYSSIFFKEVFVLLRFALLFIETDRHAITYAIVKLICWWNHQLAKPEREKTSLQSTLLREIVINKLPNLPFSFPFLRFLSRS